MKRKSDGIAYADALARLRCKTATGVRLPVRANNKEDNIKTTVAFDKTLQLLAFDRHTLNTATQRIATMTVLGASEPAR